MHSTTMNPTLPLKRLAAWSLDCLGASLPAGLHETQFGWRLGRALLDERIIPRQLTARPLRGLPVRVLCNPYVYTHRLPYWFGTLYERDLERYLRNHLKPGDTVIDVGCNVGQITTLSAALVGSAGRVYSFEPNPELAQQVSAHCHNQGLEHVTIHPFALADHAGACALHIAGDSTGTASLREEAAAEQATQVNVELRVGDDVLLPLPVTGRVFLKLDVEGSEPAVLRGIPRMLAERIDHGVVEVTPRWIGGAPGVTEIFDHWERAGFVGYELTEAGQPGRTLRAAEVTEQLNVLFLRANSR